MDWDALLIGLLSCGAVRGAYTLLDARLRVHARAYATLKPHKQKYVVKNMIKAMYLAVLLAGAVPLVLVPIARDGHWYSARIRRFGMLYVSNDAVGLACVPRLPTTTRIHHCVTICLVVAAMAIDFQTSDVGQAMLVYTVASAAAYVVNLHLAARWLLRDTETLRKTAAVIYATCCAVSWAWHLHWAWHRALRLPHLVYLGLLTAIVRDDLVLMWWLAR